MGGGSGSGTSNGTVAVGVIVAVVLAVSAGVGATGGLGHRSPSLSRGEVHVTVRFVHISSHARKVILGSVSRTASYL